MNSKTGKFTIKIKKYSKIFIFTRQIITSLSNPVEIKVFRDKVFKRATEEECPKHSPTYSNLISVLFDLLV